MKRRATTRPGFTLIELMVVVAIIALLIAIALPAFSAVRDRAKGTDTLAMFRAIDVGQETFKGERAIGGRYIPSASDSEYDNSTTMPVYGSCVDPRQSPPPAMPPMPLRSFNIPGSAFLVYGLVGADLAGSAGFRDLGNKPGWYDDFGNYFNPNPGTPASAQGLFAVYDNSSLTNAGQPVHPRYGRLVDDTISKRIETLGKLEADRVIRNSNAFTGGMTGDAQRRQTVLVDAWGRPMIYYRAKASATSMVTNLTMAGGAVGTYDQRDNQLITGISGALGTNTAFTGCNFGAGPVENNVMHKLSKYAYAKPLYAAGDPMAAVDINVAFNNSFTRFIWDKKGHEYTPPSAPPLTRNLPVRPDSYLLISAGKDAIYGTNDDILNWDKE